MNEHSSGTRAEVPPSATDSGLVDELFPVLLGQESAKPKVYVPWLFLAKYQARAEKNHGQSLNELASRGGLSPCELAAVLEDRAWCRMGDEAAWRSIYRSILRTTEGNARESASDAGSGINNGVVAPDQGSVRNATDEQDAKRYKWMRDNWAYAHGNIFFDGFRLEPRDTLDDAIDAAIRALPVLEAAND